MTSEINQKAITLKEEITPVLMILENFIVKNAIDYQQAGVLWKDLIGWQKRVISYWKDDIADATRLKESLVSKRDDLLEMAEEKKITIRQSMKSWEDAEKQAQANLVIENRNAENAVYVPINIPSGFGGATRRTWSAEVTDLMALVKAVAEGKVPIQAIEPNMVFLNSQARAMKTFLPYSGVKTVEK